MVRIPICDMAPRRGLISAARLLAIESLYGRNKRVCYRHLRPIGSVLRLCLRLGAVQQ
jgi:hypothetical protein